MIAFLENKIKQKRIIREDFDDFLRTLSIFEDFEEFLRTLRIFEDFEEFLRTLVTF